MNLVSLSSKEIALGILHSRQLKQPFKVHSTVEEYRKGLDLALKYEKNNPVIYVIDYLKARIVKTTQAEYDLVLCEKSNRFSKPFSNREDIFNKFLSVLDKGMKFVVPNEKSLSYRVN